MINPINALRPHEYAMCLTCKFFAASPASLNEFTGVCRKNPPQFVMKMLHRQGPLGTQMPPEAISSGELIPVHVDGWCGSYAYELQTVQAASAGVQALVAEISTKFDELQQSLSKWTRQDASSASKIELMR